MSHPVSIDSLAVPGCGGPCGVTGLGAAVSGVSSHAEALCSAARGYVTSLSSLGSVTPCTSLYCPVPLPQPVHPQDSKVRAVVPACILVFLPLPQGLFSLGSSSSQTPLLMRWGDSPGTWEQHRGRRELSVPGKRHCLWMLPFSQGP